MIGLSDVAPGAGTAPGANQDQKVFKILKDIKKDIEKVTPHDEFFSGHSDITEFVDLSIKARTEEPKATQAKGSSQTFQPPAGLEERNAARQALDRARRALPFLDYELNDDFRGIGQNISIPIPSRVNGAPGSPGTPRPPGSAPPGSSSRPPQGITIQRSRSVSGRLFFPLATLDLLTVGLSPISPD